MTIQACIPDLHAQRITNPRCHANPADILESLAWLRENQPLAQAVVDGFDPFWVVTKHADILEIELQPTTFVNGAKNPTLLPSETLKAMAAAPEEAKMHSLVGMDGAEHRAYRGVTQAWFAPKNVKKRSDAIRVIARAAIDKMIANGPELDFVATIGLYYPLHVIMEIFGIPESDEPVILRLSQELLGVDDPDLGRNATQSLDPEESTKTINAVLNDFSKYFLKLSTDRRREPRDDLATIIANARINEEPIRDHLISAYYLLIATAGHDTTSSSTAGAVLALATDPELMRRVRATPSLIPGFVEEAVRWVSPVRHFMRLATQDYQLRGQHIKQGDWVMLSFLSANRDEEVFTDSNVFDIERPQNRQLAFGYGPHVCIGQHLAKLEMQIFLAELLTRVETIELSGDPTFVHSVFVGGLKSLPLRFSVAGQA